MPIFSVHCQVDTTAVLLSLVGLDDDAKDVEDDDHDDVDDDQDPNDNDKGLTQFVFPCSSL